jgi:hypothetical protein
MHNRPQKQGWKSGQGVREEGFVKRKGGYPQDTSQPVPAKRQKKGPSLGRKDTIFFEFGHALVFSSRQGAGRLASLDISAAFPASLSSAGLGWSASGQDAVPSGNPAKAHGQNASASR